MPLKNVITQEIDGAEHKYALLDDEGRPLYTVDDQDVGYDGEQMHTKITELNSEAAQHRREKNEYKDKLAAFDGIEDPAAAIKALDTVKNYNDKEMMEAGEVEKVKAEAIKVVEDRWQAEIKNKYEPVMAERDKYRQRLHDEMIGGRFARSPFISEKMTLPSEMVQNSFSKFFTIEEDRVICKDEKGEEIFSKENPGSKASFDEALEILVERSPHKDMILKGTNNRGGGSPGSGEDGLPADGKYLTRAAADKMAIENPARLQKMLSEGHVVVDQ